MLTASSGELEFDAYTQPHGDTGWNRTNILLLITITAAISLAI